MPCKNNFTKLNSAYCYVTNTALKPRLCPAIISPLCPDYLQILLKFVFGKTRLEQISNALQIVWLLTWQINSNNFRLAFAGDSDSLHYLILILKFQMAVTDYDKVSQNVTTLMIMNVYFFLIFDIPILNLDIIINYK